METTRRLLILDDERTVAQTVAFAAERHGFLVRLTDSAKDFFDDVARFSPSHIIVDLLMPGMDGVEVLRNLAALGCEANIIMMSGMGAKLLESAQRAGLERGPRISGIRPKPLKPAELRALLDADVQPLSRMDAMIEADHEVSLGELEVALRTDQFVLHYQPKIRLASGKPAGVEALVRWQHPKLGLLSPDRFLPLVEQSGNMDLLTYRVIETGLAWFAEAGRGNALTLAINIAGSSLTDVIFTDVLNEQCTLLGLDPARIVLELTETSATQRTADATAILTCLSLEGSHVTLPASVTAHPTLIQLPHLRSQI